MSSIPAPPPKVSLPLANSTSRPRDFVIPDLISHCPFDLRVHAELPRVVWESKAWMINGSNISRKEKTLNSFHGLKGGGPYANQLPPLVSVLTSLRARIRLRSLPDSALP